MLRNLAVCLLVFGVIGCGESGIRLVPVQGKVTLGGKALAGKTLRFIPEPGTPGQGGGASTDKDGNYSVLATRPGATRDYAGIPAGAYKVVVTEPIFPIDMPVQNANASEPAPAIGLPTGPKKVEIPPIYSDPEKTPLRVEVPKEGGTINLPLDEKPVTQGK